MNGAQWTIYVSLPERGAASTAAGIVTVLEVLDRHAIAGTVVPMHGTDPNWGAEQGLLVVIVGDDSTGENEVKVQYVAQDLVREFEQEEALVVKVPVEGFTVRQSDDGEDW